MTTRAAGGIACARGRSVRVTEVTRAPARGPDLPDRVDRRATAATRAAGPCSPPGMVIQSTGLARRVACSTDGAIQGTTYFLKGAGHAVRHQGTRTNARARC